MKQFFTEILQIIKRTTWKCQRMDCPLQNNAEEKRQNTKRWIYSRHKCRDTIFNKGIKYWCNLFVVPGNGAVLLEMPDCELQWCIYCNWCFNCDFSLQFKDDENPYQVSPKCEAYILQEPFKKKTTKTARTQNTSIIKGGWSVQMVQQLLHSTQT